MSIPLALKYLNPVDFGLWVFASQIGIYLSLLDFGTTSAITRLLIDHKDRPNTDAYIKMIKAGNMIMLIQGALILIAGILLPYYCASFVGIPAQAEPDFCILMIVVTSAQAMVFSTRILSQLLEAHQKQFVSNYGTVVGFIAAYVTMALCFSAGLGVYSMAIATLASTISTIAGNCAGVIFYKLMPAQKTNERIPAACLREIFNLARETFLIVAGASLIMGGQTIVIGRHLGLAEAAAWSIGTRGFFLLSQLLWRPFDSSLPAFSEMLTRDETERLRTRFSDLVRFIAVTATAVAACLAVTNTSFVTIWTKGRIPWDTSSDLLLALWLITISIAHCHGMFVLITKQLSFMKYVYLIEGLASIVIASAIVDFGGIKAVIISSIICSLLLHFPYTIWHTSRFFRSMPSYKCGDWYRPTAKAVCAALPITLAIWYVSQTISLPLQLGFRLAMTSLSGVVIIIGFGLSDILRRSLTAKLTAIYSYKYGPRKI